MTPEQRNVLRLLEQLIGPVGSFAAAAMRDQLREQLSRMTTLEEREVIAEAKRLNLPVREISRTQGKL